MKNNTKTNTTTSTELDTTSASVALYQTLQDFKNSTLIVSVAVNLFVLTAWLTLHATGL